MSQVVRMVGARREMGERSGPRRERRSGEAWTRGTWLAVGLVAARLLGEGSAFAQTAPAPAAPAPGAAAAEDPDKLFAEGVQAGRQGNWAKAREKLAKAFELKPQPETAAKLGVTENRLAAQSRPEDRIRLSRDAAEHIAYYLRNAPSIPPPIRSDAEAELKKAAVTIGEVTLALDPPTAEVTVDGRPTGKAPLRGSIFVEPGHRRFEAKSEGFLPTSKELEVAAGGTYNVELTLKRDPNASPRIPSQEARGPIKDPAVPERQVEQPAWRPYVMWGGLGLAVVGVGTGVGFSVAAHAKYGEVETEVDRLVHITLNNTVICPLGAADSRCATLHGLERTHDTYVEVAIAGFAVGTVAAAGAIVATLWKPSKPAPGTPPKAGFVIVPGLRGAVVMGSF